MLKKLLRYDLKFLFRYWWIVTLASVPASVAGGWAISLINKEDVTVAQGIAAIVGVIVAIFAIAAVIIMPIVLVVIRFYKNLYSDEGYLTFTLPVTRTELLNSKVVSAFTVQLASTLVIFVDLILFILVAGIDVKEAMLVQYKFSPSHLVIGLEGIILLALSILSSTMLLYVCISLGAMIAKKHKVLAAVGIYYFAGGFIAGLSEMMISFSSSILLEMFIYGIEAKYVLLVALGIVPWLLMTAAIIVGMYTLVHWIMDRKLNLS